MLAKPTGADEFFIFRNFQNFWPMALLIAYYIYLYILNKDSQIVFEKVVITSVGTNFLCFRSVLVLILS